MPRSIAVAVVRDDPREVFVAEDQKVLNRVLALGLVARTPGKELEPAPLFEDRAACPAS